VHSFTQKPHFAQDVFHHLTLGRGGDFIDKRGANDNSVRSLSYGAGRVGLANAETDGDR
jgi:hypothetical protein